MDQLLFVTSVVLLDLTLRKAPKLTIRPSSSLKNLSEPLKKYLLQIVILIFGAKIKIFKLLKETLLAVFQKETFKRYFQTLCNYNVRFIGNGSKRFLRHNRRHHARQSSVPLNLRDIFDRQWYSCDREVLAFRSPPKPSNKPFPQAIRNIFLEPDLPLSTLDSSDSESDCDSESNSDFVVDSDSGSESESDS